MVDVTIADVAKRADVSTATVSRVLSGNRPVNPDIAKRVRSAADTLGYSGNTFARALRSSRSDTVGMIVPSLKNPFFALLMENIEHGLHERGKQLFVCDSAQDPAIEFERMRSLVARQVDGVVISPCDEEASVRAIEFGAAQVPLVQLDRQVKGRLSDWVGLDDSEAMRLVLAHLADRGVRDVAFVGATTRDSSARLRLEAFTSNLEALGLTTRPEWIKLRDYDIEWGYDAASAIASGRERPDAIVCADDLIAIGVVNACRAAGLGVPDDIKVTGFDNTMFSQVTVPPLTTIEQPCAQIADEVLRRLDEAREQGRSRNPVSISMLPTLVVRGSS